VVLDVERIVSPLESPALVEVVREALGIAAPVLSRCGQHARQQHADMRVLGDGAVRGR
jgi:hypothetical protein